ncbi:7603_t:CDS:2 [Scutellospora calospora]|uniref:7603_t:CDS:1 n=1 Tax=Scutellospora calospora TaxID=85575 RepID=A0ACA9L5F1_9GLOM|nr:7603_t:CDS:2 [Scutellospora calospora]
MDESVSKLDELEALQPQVDSEITTLYTEKIFSNWEQCETFLNAWAKKQGFQIIKNYVYHIEDVVHQQTFTCDYSRSYDSKSKKHNHILNSLIIEFEDSK